MHGIGVLVPQQLMTYQIKWWCLCPCLWDQEKSCETTAWIGRDLANCLLDPSSQTAKPCYIPPRTLDFVALSEATWQKPPNVGSLTHYTSFILNQDVNLRWFVQRRRGCPRLHFNCAKFGYDMLHTCSVLVIRWKYHQPFCWVCYYEYTRQIFATHQHVAQALVLGTNAWSALRLWNLGKAWLRGGRGVGGNHHHPLVLFHQTRQLINRIYFSLKHVILLDYFWHY